MIVARRETTGLGTKTVQSTSLALEGVDNVEGRDCLALGVLSVSDRVADDRLEEELENAASLIVNKARDTCMTKSSQWCARSKQRQTAQTHA